MLQLKSLAPFVLSASLAACATAPNTSTPKAAKPAAPAAPVYELGDLQGARAGDVDALLGAPALTRREGDGEYRRYALTTCTLIVILYPDETGVAKVAHVDATATSSNDAKPDLSACLAAG
ncbi:hypothetical protein [Hyphococcus sp.]|uniref:hypothetical protein n=1 Tax=Hyphococcus sp. TaxID=2038636 RepID=UPI00208296C0|nr:MAG: hypothetical protein DHS20C04_03010 [Marinicaulis sp.]